MKFVCLTVIFISAFHNAFSQEEPEAVVTAPVIQLISNTVYGKVVDAKTRKGLGAVSVQLYAGVNHDTLVEAMFTRPNGDFRFETRLLKDSFNILFTAVGYANAERFYSVNNAINGNASTDLGNIDLFLQEQTLSNVTITAQSQALEMGIDRRVFNVDRSLTATGGTAVDVMKNIPSVSVDVDGNVTLRNSSPQIFVDGRPTILSLDQIPANDIERVELITNPSAKFDAASTGGIINVIMKRNKRIGLNGIASAGIGYPEILTGSLSLNLRQNKFNYFLTGNYNQSGGETNGETFRQNKSGDLIESYFNQTSHNERLRKFRSARFGVDFFADNRNTISITQGIVKGTFSNDEDQQQLFLNADKVPERTGSRFSAGEYRFNRYNTQLNFTHKFPGLGRELTGNVNFNYGDGGNNSRILNQYYNPDGTLYSEPSVVNNYGENKNNQFTVQVDYMQPQNENKKFEVGIRSYVNNYQNRFDAISVVDGEEVKLSLSNNIEYKEVVNAAYFTWSQKIEKFSYQAGLRMEHSKFDGKLLDSEKEFGYDYPGKEGIMDALFPSLFLTKEISEKSEMQLNYSRRIRRPNFWQLNPFVNINDPLNISQGNPELRPEFTNSLEFNYSRNYGGGNFLGSIYYRNTVGDITRYSDTITAEQYQQFNEAAIEPNAILNTFINANSMNRVGAELTLQHKIGKNFDLTPTINGEYQMVNAKVPGVDLSNEGFNWEAKLITNYRIATPLRSFFNNFSFQMIGEYESPRIMPQGEQIPEYSVDVAIRKDFLQKKRASLTLSVNDLFWTDRDGAIYNTRDFFQETSRRNLRSFRLTFSYKFGDTEFKLFNQDNNRNGGED